MRLSAITFDGYQSGQTDFGTLLATVPQAGLTQLEPHLQLIVGQLTDPVANRRLSIIVVGHSDRQDRSDFTCDQRRSSEIAAARDRAVSAWEWVKTEVSQRVAAAGGDAGEWWETSPHVTWGLVFAAAGMLQHDPPSDEQRPLNRRVVMLISAFEPE